MFLMVLLLYFVVLMVFSHNLKQYGVKQIVIKFHVLFLLIKWIVLVLITLRVVDDINKKLKC